MSDQLDLFEKELSRLPWRGRSPRSLTRGSKALFLRREPQKDASFVIGPEQLELFHVAKARPREISPGAPLLLPFDRR